MVINRIFPKRFRHYRRQISLFAFFLLIILIPVIASQLYSAYQSIAAGNPPEVFWKFDEGNGQTAGNTVSTSYAATLGSTASDDTNVPTWQSDGCPSGNCLNFDGTNDYVNGGDIPFTGTGVTVAGWVRFDTIPTNGASSTTRKLILEKYDAPNNEREFTLILGHHTAGTIDDPDSLVWGVQEVPTSYNTNNEMTSNFNFEAGKWYHVAATFDSASSMKIYVNGQLDTVKTANVATDFANTAQEILLGGNATETYLDGQLDEMKVYSYARSEAQIKADYADSAAARGAVAGFSNDNQAFLTDGLVGYWSLNESSWTNDCSTATVSDYSGNGLSALSCPASTGPTGGALGKYSKAGDFDGSDDYLRIADNSLLEPSSALTISAWVNFDTLPTTSDAKIVYKEHSSSPWMSYELAYDETTQRLFFSIVDSGGTYHTAYSQDKPATGVWHHVTGVWTGSDIRIFVNGVGGPSYPAAPSLYNSNSYIYIGKAGGNPVDGKIDEVRIYKRALSVSEINKLYQWQPGPVAHYRFDDGTGTTIGDSSGSNRNLTGSNVGSSNWLPGKYGTALSFNGTNTSASRSYDSGFDFGTGDFSLSTWVNVGTAVPAATLTPSTSTVDVQGSLR